MKFFLILIISVLFLSSVSAWELEKHLVQIEVDENYPCHLEGETIVCPALDNANITEWANKQIGNEERDTETGKKIIDKGKEKRGEYTGEEIKGLIMSGVAPMYIGSKKEMKSITEEHRYKVNVYALGDDLIKIGFATNVFGVSGTPLENFDVNSTTGMVRYRPLNMTWLNFITNANSLNTGILGNNALITGKNYTISIWFNMSGNAIESKLQNLFFTAGSTGEIVAKNNNTGLLYFCYQAGTACHASVYDNQTRNDSLWHNLVVVAQRNMNISFYMDGVLINKTNISSSTDWYTGLGLQIGSYASDSLTVWKKGGLDEFRLFNIDLTASQILQIYTSGRTRNNSLTLTSNIVYYPMNERFGLVSYGLSNNSNNGTITGATWQSDNINVSTLGYNVNISIQNITNALIFWDNYTLINLSFSGNKTFEFYYNDTIYIQENFDEITQGISYAGSVVNVTEYSSNEFHIINNLDITLTRDVIIDVPSCNLKTISYTPHGGVATTPIYTCSGTQLTLSGLTINPSSTSNVITITYQVYKNADTSDICVYMVGSYSNFFQYVPTFFILIPIIGIILIIGFLVIKIQNPSMFEDLDISWITGDNVKWFVIGILILGVLAIVSILSLVTMCSI